MSNPTLIKSYRAASAAAGYTIAKITAELATDNAAAANDPLIGTYDAMGAEAGQMSDVVHGGIGEVRLGGTVAAGDQLTSDANGHAVAIAPGATARTIGIAVADGVDDDIISYLAAPGSVTVPAA